MLLGKVICHWKLKNVALYHVHEFAELTLGKFYCTNLHSMNSVDFSLWYHCHRIEFFMKDYLKIVRWHSFTYVSEHFLTHVAYIPWNQTTVVIYQLTLILSTTFLL